MRRFFKIVALLPFIAFLLVSLFITVIRFKPLPLGPFLGQKKNSLEFSGQRIEFSSLELYFSKGFGIRAQNAKLISSYPLQPTSLAELNVRLRILPLFAGKVIPKKISLKGLSFQAELEQQGFSIGGIPLSGSSEDKKSSFDLISFLNQIQDEKSKVHLYLSSLQALSIEQSQIVFTDQLHGQEWKADRIKIFFNKQHKHSLDAALRLSLHRQNDEMDLVLRFSHKAGASEAQLDAELNIPSLKMLTGYVPQQVIESLEAASSIKASTTLKSGNSVGPLHFKTRNQAGLLHLPTIYSKPLAFKEIKTEGDFLWENNGTLNLQSVKFVDPSGFALETNMTLSSLQKDPQLKLASSFSNTSIDHLSRYFPDRAAPGLSSWLSSNLSLADISSAKFELLGPLSEFPFATAKPDTKFSAGFDYNNLSVKFLDRAAPGQSLSGNFLMDRGAIKVSADRGMLAEQAVSRLTVGIADVLEQTSPIMLSVTGDASGELNDALRFVTGIVANDSKLPSFRGNHVSTVNLSLPLTGPSKPDSLVFSVSGKAPKLGVDIPNTTLKVEADTSFEANNSQLQIKGSGLLNQRPADFFARMSMKNFAEQFEGKLTAEAAQDVYGAYLPSAYVHLEGIAKLTLSTKRKGAPVWNYDLALDLQKTRAALPAVGWEKGPGAPAQINLSGAYTPQEHALSIDKGSLSGPQLSIGAKANLALKNLAGSKLNLSPLIINDANLQLQYENSKVSISGRRLNLAALKLPQGKEGNNTSPDFEASANIGEVQFQAGTLRQVNAQARRKNSHWELLNLQAKISNSGSLNLASEEGPKLALNSTDAGALLSLISEKPSIQGGSCSGEIRFPKSKEVNLQEAEGSIAIKNGRILHSPILWDILSFFSLQQWLDPMKGGYFSQLAFSFALNQPNLIISDLQFTGAIVSIFASGNMNVSTGDLDFKGKAVPLQRVGKLVEDIPLIGGTVSDLQKKVLGAPFTVKGNTDKPKVSFLVSPF